MWNEEGRPLRPSFGLRIGGRAFLHESESTGRLLEAYVTQQCPDSPETSDSHTDSDRPMATSAGEHAIGIRWMRSLRKLNSVNDNNIQTDSGLSHCLSLGLI